MHCEHDAHVYLLFHVLLKSIPNKGSSLQRANDGFTNCGGVHRDSLVTNRGTDKLGFLTPVIGRRVMNEAW